jgi:hypothetical protein
MPIAPAVPWIAQGAGALVGALAGKKSQSNAMKRSPEETAALGGASTAAQGAGQTAQSLTDESRPYVSQPAGYYQTLLHGNRAAMAQATAAPRAQIQEGYRGAQTGLARSGIRGAAKDVLSGQLGRQKVGQIAGQTTGVQPWAAGQLAGLGTDIQKTGAQLYGTSGNIYRDLLGQGFTNRKYARDEGAQTGKAIGGLVADIGGAWRCV